MKHWEIAPQKTKTLGELEGILGYWRWFRERCARFYAIEGLPETFGENDGEIHEHNWVDPEEDWTAPPPEYNYDWRTQELRWEEKGYTISFLRNDDTYSQYIRFEIKNEPGVYIKLRLSQRGKGEAELKDTEEKIALWEKDIRALTEPAG